LNIKDEEVIFEKEIKFENKVISIESFSSNPPVGIKTQKSESSNPFNLGKIKSNGNLKEMMHIFEANKSSNKSFKSGLKKNNNNNYILTTHNNQPYQSNRVENKISIQLDEEKLDLLTNYKNSTPIQKHIKSKSVQIANKNVSNTSNINKTSLKTNLLKSKPKTNKFITKNQIEFAFTSRIRQNLQRESDRSTSTSKVKKISMIEISSSKNKGHRHNNSNSINNTIHNTIGNTYNNTYNNTIGNTYNNTNIMKEKIDNDEKVHENEYYVGLNTNPNINTQNTGNEKNMIINYTNPNDINDQNDQNDRNNQKNIYEQNHQNKHTYINNRNIMDSQNPDINPDTNPNIITHTNNNTNPNNTNPNIYTEDNQNIKYKPNHQFPTQYTNTQNTQGNTNNNHNNFNNKSYLITLTNKNYKYKNTLLTQNSLNNKNDKNEKFITNISTISTLQPKNNISNTKMKLLDNRITTHHELTNNIYNRKNRNKSFNGMNVPSRLKMLNC